jgi:hypothetical protein
MKVNLSNSTIENLTINITEKTVDTGPITKTIEISCSRRFKEFLEYLSETRGQPLAEMLHRYLVEGASKDVKEIFMLEPYLHKPLRELLKKEDDL